jgi:hypothetical protein
MFLNNRARKIMATLALAFVMSTLHAQTPTPTAEPTPACTSCEQAMLDEAVVLRRLVMILGGTFFGWNVCLLLFKYH